MGEPENRPPRFNPKLGLQPFHEGPMQPEEGPPRFRLRLDNENLWLLAGGAAFIVAAALYISLMNGGAENARAAAFGVFVGLLLVGGLILSFVFSWSAYLIALAEYRIRNRGRR